MSNPAPQRDDNGYPSWAGISCVDGVTIVPIVFNTNHEMLTDSTTVISVVPAHINSGGNTPIKTGVSSVDKKTVLPFYVNPATGAVLVDFT
jgi:hypothetical protein